MAPAGSEIPLLAFAADEGQHYRAWAEDYYEKPISAEAVKNVLQRQSLSEGFVASINPEASWDEILSDAEEIGYPH